MERTLVVIKPDGVQRSLIGDIIRRYEQGSLRLAGLKMLTADRKLVSRHYTDDRDYLISLGKKSEQAGDKIDDYEAQGRMIVNGLRKYLTSGPVVAMVLEGENAIKKARQITGYTDPVSADKGTIRGDLGQDSIQKANREKRPVFNLIHASGEPAEARKEIALWFRPEELSL